MCAASGDDDRATTDDDRGTGQADERPRDRAAGVGEASVWYRDCATAAG